MLQNSELILYKQIVLTFRQLPSNQVVNVPLQILAELTLKKDVHVPMTKKSQHINGFILEDKINKQYRIALTKHKNNSPNKNNKRFIKTE